MAHSSFTDSSSDLGRQLTVDVGILSLTLPMVAHGAFYQVVLPFVFTASLVLVVLFALPIRDVPFVAQHGTHGLSTLRTSMITFAVGNLFIAGYPDTDFLSLRWLLAAAAATLTLAVLTIDLRRMFTS